MKKMIAIILTAALMMSLTACKNAAENGSENDLESEPKVQESAEEVGGLAGGWNVSGDGEEVAMPEEAKEAFDKAMEGLEGVKYVPVVYLGSQVVAGVNYRYLCKSTVVTANPVTKLTVVTVYRDLGGNAEATDFAEVSIPELIEGAELEFDPAEVAGGWTVSEAVGAGMDEAAQEAFDKATKDMTGVGYEPLAVLGTQVVAGINYTILCKATTVTAEPVTALAVMTIYQDLQGGAEITGIKAFEVPQA